VGAATDLAATTTEQHEHESDDGEDDAHRPENGHPEQEADEHEDESGNNHGWDMPDRRARETSPTDVTQRVARNVCLFVSILARSRLATLAFGLLGGCALGVVARVWMRVISDDPEFTWSGTIFIVGGFTIFGFGQSLAAVARRRNPRRWMLTIVRVIAAITMMPLFFAAGGIMFPTVIGGALARFRGQWPFAARFVSSLIATAPVVIVGKQIVDSFDWSLHALAGFVMMLAVYGVIVSATRFVVAPQLDGWRVAGWARVAGPLVAFASIGLIVLATTGLG
jgi:hypothetical protein